MTESKNESIAFNFTWKALELLGKSLYSNAWSAISELVANGFDAGSTNVYVYVDATDKKHSNIEIMDEGAGLSKADMLTYVKIGYDKRLSIDASNADSVMGRKGIGKLAALFLSNDYYMQTKTTEGISTWRLKVNEDDPDSIPCMVKQNSNICILTPKWNEIKHGTLLKLNNVDLSGLGQAAFEALSKRLANQFQLSSMSGKEIYLAIKSTNVSDPEFSPVKKSVAFKNMLSVAYHYASPDNIPAEIVALSNNSSVVKLNVSRNRDVIKEAIIKTTDLSELESSDYPITGTYISNGREYQYALEGWIGTHATIDKDIAQSNDKNFEKNQFYNPSQIRLYVRNKLACENLLTQLAITQTYANYIEGEVHFDLLDINDLPDIATSNRQNFVEDDERWRLLKNILRPIVRALITNRTSLIKDLKEDENKMENERRDKAKKKAANNVSEELEKYEGLSDQDRNELSTIIAAQFEGDVNLSAKERYKIFISHKSEDKFITDFFYWFLIHRGAEDDDFFYTSNKEKLDYSSLEPISKQIKENITCANTLVVFFTSPYFLKSQFCLFEGGAAWATRAVGEYSLITTTYEGIPAYLTNGKFEYDLSAEGAIELNRSNYNNIVELLNTMIRHINKGREISGALKLEEIPKVNFPDDVELNKSGKKLQDYMDEEIVDYWNQYIVKGLQEYSINPPSSSS